MMMMIIIIIIIIIIILKKEEESAPEGGCCNSPRFISSEKEEAIPGHEPTPAEMPRPNVISNRKYCRF